MKTRERAGKAKAATERAAAARPDRWIFQSQPSDAIQPFLHKGIQYISTTRTSGALRPIITNITPYN
jgi:hypothetical protein